MKKKTILIAVIISIILFWAGFLLGKLPIKNITRIMPAAETETSGGNVSLVKNTTPEMLNADHWIREGSDQILFTAEEISNFNENNPLYVLYYNSSLGKDRKLFMNDLPDELTKEMSVSLLNPDFLNKMRYGNSVYINGEKPDDSYWEALSANCQYEAIMEHTVPLYAVCVSRTMAYSLPTEDFASSAPAEIFCNDLVSAEMMPFTGAVIIHESADGEWYYVIYGSICGWVRKEYLAVCHDKEEWSNACAPEEYLVVTGLEITLDETAYETSSSRQILPMGTKIRLLSDPPASVNGRSTLGCYVVQLPCKDEDGFLAWENTLIPVSVDVHEGPLQMTSAAVINQAFKFLGHVYGWGGSMSSNDCSGIVRQVYSCFGFELPRNAAAIILLADLGRFNCSEMSIDKKLELLKQIPAGTLLYMSGHIMIFLGMDNDNPYVISSCATYISPDDETMTMNNAYCIFVSDLNLVRANGDTWLESIDHMQWKGY